jgi:glucosamine--fructose-6-phosphate aminotransferase (isomerizing)
VATKSFIGQLGVLTLMAAALGQHRGTLDDAGVAAIARELRTVPEHIGAVLEGEPRFRAVAEELAERRSMFFFGRGFGYPVAMEGALKLKEISYIHAEGYPAGELKHGPIAMLDPSIPVFAVATASPTHGKVISNIEEVRARGAQVIAVATEGDDAIGGLAEHVFFVPRVREELSPFVGVIPMQLFAYHVAVTLGRDVDQPRNLAKSVTVE